MVVGVGYANSVPTLIPYLELTLQEPEGDQPDPELSFEPMRIYSKSLMHDNAAFIMGQLAEDLLESCSQLRTLASGSLKPEPTRIRRSRDYLAEAQGNLQKCVMELEHLLAPAEDAP